MHSMSVSNSSVPKRIEHMRTGECLEVHQPECLEDTVGQIPKKLCLTQCRRQGLSYAFSPTCVAWHVCANIHIYKNMKYAHTENIVDLGPHFHTFTELLRSTRTSVKISACIVLSVYSGLE